MIDWLRRKPARMPSGTTVRAVVQVAGRDLPLRIRRLASSRQMTLRLAADGSEAHVTLPHWGGVGEAEAFVRARSDWLAHQLEAIPKPIAIEPGATFPYRGERLRIEWRDDAPRKPVLDDGAVVLGGPLAALETRLRRWLEAEALGLFAADAEDFARVAGLATPRVLLTRAKRRWGSCTAGGIVRVNWRLVMAPDHVRRSVVAHEIAHLVHFDHGRQFRGLLVQIYDGDLTAANGWFKREGRSLYAAFP